MTDSLKKARDILKTYGFKSLFVQFLKTVFLIIIIPIIIFSVIFSCFFFDSEKKQTENIHKKNRTVMENIITETTKSAIKFRQDNDCLSYIAMRKLDYMVNTKYISHLRNEMNDFINSTSYMDSIYLYTPNTGYIITNRSGTKIENFEDTNWLKYYEKTGNTNFFINSDSKKTKKNYVSIAYGLKMYSNTYAILVYNINADYLKNAVYSDKSENYIIAGEKIIFSSKKSEIPNLTEYIKIHKNVAINEELGIKGGSLLSRIDKDVFFITIPGKRPEVFRIILFTAFIILIILLVFIVSFYVSIKFYTSIAEIVSTVTTSDSNPYSGDFNEVSYIKNNIRLLTSNKNKAETDLLKKISDLKKAQITALQTQINPHFIFNTLGLSNMIIMSIIKKPNDAEKVISLLANFISYTLDTKEYIVTFQTELEMTKKYIQIENIKHKNSFDIYYEIEDKVLDSKVIKHIIQPIIENAFSHGIKYLEDKKGLIKIKGYIKNEIINIEIINNGIKIPEEKLKILNESIKSAFIPESNHIGISNVNARIKLFYGNDYGLKISSDEEYTKITLFFPQSY